MTNLYDLINTFQFFNYVIVAKRWISYMNSWHILDQAFKNAHIYDKEIKSTKRNIILWFHIFIGVAIIQLILFFTQSVLLSTTLCQDEEYDGSELVFRQTFPEIFKVLGYNFGLEITVLLLFIDLSFSRNFDMALIIITSKLLTRRFEIFNEKLSLNLFVSISLILNE